MRKGVFLAAALLFLVSPAIFAREWRSASTDNGMVEVHWQTGRYIIGQLWTNIRIRNFHQTDDILVDIRVVHEDGRPRYINGLGVAADTMRMDVPINIARSPIARIEIVNIRRRATTTSECQLVSRCRQSPPASAGAKGFAGSHNLRG